MSVTSPGRLIVANRTEGRNFKLDWHGNIYAVDYWVILANSPRKASGATAPLYDTARKPDAPWRAISLTGLTNIEANRRVDPKLSSIRRATRRT